MSTNEIWTIMKVLDWTAGFLAEKGVENSRREAEWLMCEAIGLDRIELYLGFDKPLQEDELAACRKFVARRGKREPLQYILGSQEFFGLDFDISPSVLIPRYDTEILVQEALKRTGTAAAILDIGTGSGCIAISLAFSLPDASVCAVDISAKAIETASANARKHQLNIEFLQGSFFQPVAGRRFNLIVSNPPYIATSELAALQPEVRNYEPLLALDGGTDGFSAFRTMLEQASEYLEPDGWLIFEAGAGQDGYLASMFDNAGFTDIFSVPDTAGIQRVIGGKVHGI